MGLIAAFGGVPLLSVGQLLQRRNIRVQTVLQPDSERVGMGRNTTERIALTPETKALLDEAKPDGVTFDHWVRNDPRLQGDA